MSKVWFSNLVCQELRQSLRLCNRNNKISSFKPFGRKYHDKKELEDHTSEFYNTLDSDQMDACWGEGNTHTGYFPHLAEKDNKYFEFCETNKLSFEEAATELTKYMIYLSKINEKSNVVDFGCGRGKGTIDFSQYGNCKALGLDFAQNHINFSKNLLLKQDLTADIEFVKGSFLDIDECKEIWNFISTNGPITHVVCQESLLHFHGFLDQVLLNVKSILDKNNGKLVISDWMSKHDNLHNHLHNHLDNTDIFKELGIQKIASISEYKNTLENHGFKILHFEDTSKHQMYGYQLVSQKAKKIGFEFLDESASAATQLFKTNDLSAAVIVAQV